MLQIHSIDGYPVNPGPRIRLWDVELGKMLIEMMTYSLKQYSNFLNPMTIKRDVWLVCASWKLLGDHPIESVSVLDDPIRFARNYADDYVVVKAIHDMICDTDILIAHNGDNFDWKKFTSRCIAHGLTPPPKPKMIDTLKVARREFGFSSNSLRYLAHFLGVTDKDEAPDWDLVSTGDIEEIKKCVSYNGCDVDVLEKVYYKELPYITNHPKLIAAPKGFGLACDKCGGFHLQSRGYAYTRSKKIRRFQCQGCGGWTDEDKAKPMRCA